MRRLFKVLIILAIPVTVIAFINQDRVIEFGGFLVATGWIWALAATPIIFIFVYIIGEHLDVWRKVKMSEKIKGDKKIPQGKRIAIAKEWTDINWLTRTAGKTLILVNNYFTPDRDDAQPMEMFLFTTSQAYGENRIAESEIPAKECFYTAENCYSGECFSMDYLSRLTFEGAVRFMNHYWFTSIKQKVETPLELWMKKSMAEATGEEVVRESFKRKEGEIKNEE
jgi:hypothetical protein